MIEITIYELLEKLNINTFSTVLPQDTPKPAIVYSVINQREISGALGCSPLKNIYLFQIDVYDTQDYNCRVLRNTIITKLREIKAYNIKHRDGFEQTLSNFRQIIEFNIKG